MTWLLVRAVSQTAFKKGCARAMMGHSLKICSLVRRKQSSIAKTHFAIKGPPWLTCVSSRDHVLLRVESSWLSSGGRERDVLSLL